MADNVLEPYTFSFGDAKSASTGCSSRVWMFPTSILQRKWCLHRQTHCLRVLWNLSTCFPNLKIILQSRPSVFKFNLKRAVIFFLLRRFLRLHPQQTGRVGTNSQFFESVFYKSDFKNTCWASPKPNIQCKNHAERANFLREKRFSKIGVDSFNIASNRNYYFRFWRQKAELMGPKKSSDFMVCSIQNIF